MEAKQHECFHLSVFSSAFHAVNDSKRQ